MPKKSKSGELHEAIQTGGREEMDDIERKIISVIRRLKGEEGQHLHFFLLDRDSHLKNYSIFRKEETDWWQWLWGDYIDIATFYSAILDEFGLVPTPDEEDAYRRWKNVYLRWSTVQDAVDYVRRRLTRKEKQREQEPSEQLDQKEREREKRSKRMKKYWKARKRSGIRYRVAAFKAVITSATSQE